jgi:UV DNA damage endonuclease
MNLGYACICMSLSKNLPRGQEKVTTNRSMIKRTYLQKGVAYASELSLKNCEDLEKIIEWNEQNNIKFFRMSSEIFPWASEHGIKALPDYDRIAEVLHRAGNKAKQYGQRLSFHPGPFNVLTSDKEKVVLNTIKDLSIHGEVMDLLDQPRTPYAKINIHVGATYGDKPAALARFCENFHRLPESVKTRLTVENDDRASMYSTRELVEKVHSRIGIPVVHDLHHHTFCTGGLSNKDALGFATKTWGDVKPVVHYSQSRAEEYGDPTIMAKAHSDSYWTAVDTYGYDVDVMLECKHKEQGLFKMRELLGQKG